MKLEDRVAIVLAPARESDARTRIGSSRRAPASWWPAERGEGKGVAEECWQQVARPPSCGPTSR